MLPEGHIAINSIFQWRTLRLRVLNWPQSTWGEIAEPRTPNVVVFLLRNGPSPHPGTAPASCRASGPVAGNAGGRHTSLSRLWSPLPAVAGVSPPPLLCWFRGCCLPGFFSLPETTKSLFSPSDWKLISALVYCTHAVLTKEPFASIYLSEAGLKNVD